jgi:uncharacterized protein YjiS (DUF1127 family)
MPAFTRLRAAFHSFQGYRAKRRAFQQLAAMDDALLKDIGISRSRILSVVNASSDHRSDTT